MFTIILIGAGNIGSRHLQGLARLEMEANIYVIDPLESSLEIAEKRFEEVKKNKKINIHYQFNLDIQTDEIDIAIIATNSKIRKSVCESLVSAYKVKYIIFEKFLFQDIRDYKIVSDILLKYNIKSWVNCPRRLFPIYSELKELLKSEEKIEFHASGSNWGLGCNGIHFIDLFSFLSNSQYFVTSVEMLDDEIIQSKREGYIEFTGSIILRDQNENSCFISSYRKEHIAMNITINTNRYQITILENGSESKVILVDKKNNFITKVDNFSIPFQSELTGSIIESILKKGECLLATYEESRSLHETVLNTFISFLQKKHNDKSIQICPIT